MIISSMCIWSMIGRWFVKDNGDVIGLIDGFKDGDIQYGSQNPVFKSLRESQFLLKGK